MTFEPTTDKKIDSEILSEDDATSSQAETPTSKDLKTKKVPWYAYIWDYEPDRTHEERVFVSKLDAYLITILSLGYFIKNLDQTEYQQCLRERYEGGSGHEW